MKKFLFTLAALLSLGFSANAQTAPTFAMSESEITLMPGESKEIVISLVDRGSTGAIKGMQMDWDMLNPNGEKITSGCHLEFLEKYGPDADHWNWFGEISGVAGNTMTSRNGSSHNTTAWDEEGDYMPGNEYGVDAEIVYTGTYNYIVMNATTGICYSARLALPKEIIAFTIKADEDWADEYATFTQTKNAVSASVEVQANLMNVKIINGAKQTKEFEGVIEIGDADGTSVPVTYMTNDPNATATVTVNGTAANVAFTVEGPDAEGVYTGTATVTLTDGVVNNVVATLTPSEAYEGEAETANKSFDLRKAAEISIQRYEIKDGQCIIMIAPEEGAGELTYAADPEADDVKVENGITYLYYNMGAEEFEVEIMAETAESNTLKAGEETAKITVPALDKVKTPSINAVIDDPEDGKITVYAESTTQGATCYVVGPDNVAHEAPYTFEYDIYEGVNENWYAYATAPYMLQSDNSDAYNIYVEKQEKLYQTDTPEIVSVNDDEREVVVITVTGEGNIVVTVTGLEGEIATETGTSPVVVEVPYLAVGSEPEFVTVKAVATAELPAGYDRVLPATATLPVEVPAKQEVVPTQLPGEIVFGEVDENGKFDVWYEGDVQGVVITVDAPVVANRDGQYSLPEPNVYYNVTAHATHADYDLGIDKTEKLIWNKQITPELEPSDKAEFGDPVIDENTVTVHVTGNVTGAVDQNGNAVDIDDNGNMVFERPAYPAESQTFVVTVTTNDGDGYADATAEVTVLVPVKLPAPNIVVTESDAYGWYPDPSGALQENGEPVMVYGIVGKNYVLTDIETEVAGGTVWYTVTWNDEQGNAKVWDGTDLPLVGTGVCTIVAHVTLGEINSAYDIWSHDMSDNFTGVNEIMNGKAVAGVRYFNMAGQEMQEANGVTIVVTTYTDGTTSAVKVIK